MQKKSIDHFDLMEAFAEPGCGICRLLQRDEYRFLDSLLYEYTTEFDVHQSIRASRGLCSAHSWQLTNYRGATTGIAVLYEAVMDELVGILDRAPRDPSQAGIFGKLLGANGDGAALAGRISPAKPCMCCASLATSEKRYIKDFASWLDIPELRESYENSEGLCLGHFRLLLDVLKKPAHLQLVVSTQKRIYAKLRDDLALFRSKVDARRTTEPIGEEGGSWRKAIESIAGARSLTWNDEKRHTKK